jgi:hypothetical protein
MCFIYDLDMLQKCFIQVFERTAKCMLKTKMFVLHNMLQKCFRCALFMIQICFKNAFDCAAIMLKIYFSTPIFEVFRPLVAQRAHADRPDSFQKAAADNKHIL